MSSELKKLLFEELLIEERPLFKNPTELAKAINSLRDSQVTIGVPYLTGVVNGQKNCSPTSKAAILEAVATRATTLTDIRSRELVNWVDRAIERHQRTRLLPIPDRVKRSLSSAILEAVRCRPKPTLEMVEFLQRAQFYLGVELGSDTCAMLLRDWVDARSGFESDSHH